MKAIILAAGEGTRLRPLTYQKPKAMVNVGEKSLLEHNMDTLLPYVDEFIIVIKYKKETITEYFGSEYKGIKVSYHEQGEAKGTAAALWGIKTTGDCLIIASDTIFAQEDIDKLMEESTYGALVQEVENPEKYGIFETDQNGIIKKVVEKPKEYIGNLASLFYFKGNSEIVSLAEDVKVSPRGEYELTDAINEFVKTVDFRAIKLQHPFTDITSLADLEKANKTYFPLPKFGETRYLESIGELELHIGISNKFFGDIVKNSTNTDDTALQKNTSDIKRFSTEENLEKWYFDEARYTFTLVSKAGEIAGLLWYRPSLPPIITQEIDTEKIQELFEKTEFAHTGGIRIYQNFRGKGLATPFLEQSEKYYEQIFPTGWICIDIDTENIASQKAYEKAGYRFIGYGENQKTVQNETHQRMIYVKDFNENVGKK